MAGCPSPFVRAFSVLSPSADIIVTGTLVPDATGAFNEDGDYNGEMSYKRLDSAYYIWYDDGMAQYTMSTGKGIIEGAVWVSATGLLNGSYMPDSEAAEGTATVTVQ